MDEDIIRVRIYIHWPSYGPDSVYGSFILELLTSLRHMNHLQILVEWTCTDSDILTSIRTSGSIVSEPSSVAELSITKTSRDHLPIVDAR